MFERFGFPSFLLGICVTVWLIQRRNRIPLPPGPRGYPLIGNLLDIPTSYEWLTWSNLGEKWGKYRLKVASGHAQLNSADVVLVGDLCSLSVLGNTIIVINSYSQAVKMLNEKSEIYSERPYVPMATVTSGFGDMMGLLPNDRRLWAYRKMFHDGFGTNAGIRTFYPQQEYLSNLFIKKLLKGSGDLLDHCFHHSGASILRIAYGYEVEESNDPMIAMSTLAVDNFSQATAPGRFLVNTIPLLLKAPDWCPGTAWKATGKKWAKDYRDMEDLPFKFTKLRHMQGRADDCFVVRWLGQSLSPQEEKELKHAAASMFAGGAETTTITIYAFILMMCLYQDVQKRVQHEIDDVIGLNRLPTCEDRNRLPYLRAVLKEVNRFHTLAPCSVPHSTSADDIQDGKFIPKGSIVFPNIWKMAHDPSTYKDPMVFDPTRFLGDSQEQDPNEYIFGFGRRSIDPFAQKCNLIDIVVYRVCPGRLLADVSLFITAAMMLFAFDISPLPGEPPVYESLPGIISRVRPFKCRITPRKDIVGLTALMEE
ncbi:hypothetical protein D9758_007690 [Tetrapyrgos nigripes]|uniref:Cytochrome P450 n=1 Tax=Tetrapyrgos nigripes TaxID=182062 RepID=A0A8H5G530_9AGAR|nr:hypothetical protein D9758_007690 [Tetrapyrgos nigripes]